MNKLQVVIEALLLWAACTVAGMATVVAVAVILQKLIQ